MPNRPTRSPSDGTRRAPIQTRSRQRLEDILEVTAGLVDEIGPDAVTTTMIAEQLGISVGSIYAYFVDRSAIFDEIVVRAIAQHDRLIDATHERLASASWTERSFAVIDLLVDLYRNEPGFRSLWFSRHLSAEMVETMRESDEIQAQHGLERLHASGLRLDCPNPMNTMRMYVGLVDKGLDLAFHLDPKGDKAMIDETKRLVRLYIEPAIVPRTTRARSGARR